MLIAVLLAGIIFYECFVALKTLASVRSLQTAMTGSVDIVRSTTMSDEEKASAMRGSSIATLSGVAVIAAKMFAAGALATAFLFIVSLFVWPFEQLLAYSVTPLALAATLIFLTGYGFLRHGRRKA